MTARQDDGKQTPDRRDVLADQLAADLAASDKAHAERAAAGSLR